MKSFVHFLYKLLCFEAFPQQMINSFIIITTERTYGAVYQVHLEKEFICG